MKFTVKICSLVAALSLASGVFACDRPSAPVVPDASSAVTPQMMKAKNDVKAYMDAANAYLACERNDGKYNAMVDEMNSIADAYNTAVRDFKERMAAN